MLKFVPGFLRTVGIAFPAMAADWMNWLKWLIFVPGLALAPPGFAQSISIQPQIGCVAPPTGATIFYWNPSVAQGTSANGSAFGVAGVGSPDCLKSASTITEDTSTGGHNIEMDPSGGVDQSITSGSLTVSVWVKQGPSLDRNAGLAVFDSAFAHQSTAGVNLPACTAEYTADTTFPGATVTGTYTQEPNNWCKVQLTTTPVTLTGVSAETSMLSGTNGTYTGNGTSKLYVWGFQVQSP